MNAARGEVGLMIGGVERRLCLTLGALAEMEAAFGCTRISELEARLRTASAADVMVVLAALLRGGGEVPAVADVAPGEAAAAITEAFRRGLSV
ncbi:MAG: GTA-gp10 family protein [Hyphomonas sp.]|jgi:hypothetical protein